MRYTQENFQEWIFFISDKMEYFTGTFAKEHGLVLDYSKKSLDDLERWILDNLYVSPMTFATACISRNKGNYISTILLNRMKNMGIEMK